MALIFCGSDFPKLDRIGVGVGEAVVPRRAVTVTLSVDHRVSDGRGANRFLAALADALQSPETPWSRQS